ncbi:TrkH family potassium uptake protein [Roseovarius faecimaris]|uniref:TrkH family potassium uptake protein n=1 Tax=Roseovarius faecimaris TaxID=2494550 RepID=A0A6I6IN31_9RHOB|nr:potassium transporter TrkG [Roseovarius faecimaris]QGX98439.1 TrkH family potassium uptake protein [Roseovarius faecimaris]
MQDRLLSFPLILILSGISALMMLLPAIDALTRQDHSVARVFFYASVLGLAFVMIIGLAMSGRERTDNSDFGNLLSLLLAYTLLPLYLAVPFYEGLETTRFINAYLEMVSAITTTGLPIFDQDPGRLVDSLHLWRGLVGWMGGLLIWVSASAVLAPLNLGGFEVTASAEPGQGGIQMDRFERANSAKRLAQITYALGPLYVALTAALWFLLLLNGDRSFVALIHAMSVMATSGISSVGGVQNGASGFGGEAVMFLFLLFALSRLTFSSDTATMQKSSFLNDPEFRIGLLLVAIVPLLLFARHWLAAFDVDEVENVRQAARALWGGAFTVLSFLSTTGFESASWGTAREWSGLGTPGLILLGLSLVGGGVATTAGGVKLLRVYALYLNGRREMERLVHPSSVGRARGQSRRIRREGAFIAWIFFMLFAISLALITVVLAALGQDFESAIVLSIATLSTTGPLASVATEEPIALLQLGTSAKLVLSAAMVLGRMETLAIIALLNPAIWRD